MSQSSRQLKFPGQHLPETVVRTMDDDSELQVTALISTQGSENVDLKPLDISSNETDTYVSCTNKTQTNCKESVKDDFCAERFLTFSETKKLGAEHDGSSGALCHRSQDQVNIEGSPQSLDVDEKQHHYLSQTVASVKQENNSDAYENNFPLSSVKSKSQLEDKKEILTVPSTSTPKQKSVLSFAKKSNIKAGSTKSSLKQTDIGVFFGLKPLTKPVENKLTSAQSDAKGSSSSQSSAVSHRPGPGSWRGRKYNRSGATNIDSVSEGQSSGPGEDPSAPQSKKNCPFYKRIPDSAITVDAFCYGNIPGCCAYFLSHFHYDHYRGLNGKFANPVYCSKVSEGPSVS